MNTKTTVWDEFPIVEFKGDGKTPKPVIVITAMLPTKTASFNIGGTNMHIMLNLPQILSCN